jgi:hypothetical protein
MVQDPSWDRQAAAKTRAKGASCVACMAFLAGMGAAFWIGTLWASQSWMAFTR